MVNIVRIESEERDRQWRVTQIDADGVARPGEPFPAYGGERYSKLEQVLGRLTHLRYRPT